MKKLLLVALITLLYTNALNAQELSFGLKGGLNYYSIGDMNSRGGSIMAGRPDEIFTPNKDIGTQFGAFMTIEFNKLYVRPELNFVAFNNTYEFPNKPSQWRARKIEIPALVGYKIFDPVSIYMGPSFSLFNKMTLEGANNSTTEDSINFNKTATTLNFGIQVEFKRFGIDLRYGLGLNETDEELQDINNSAYGTNLTDIYSYKPSELSLSFNIYVFRTNSSEIGGLFTNLFKGSKCYCPY